MRLHPHLRLHHHGVICYAGAVRLHLAGKRLHNQGHGKYLRRLCLPHHAAVRAGLNHPLLVHQLDGILDRHTHHAGIITAHSPVCPLNDFAGNKGAGPVMDKHVSVLSVPGRGFPLLFFPVHQSAERLPYALVPLAAPSSYGAHLLQSIRLHDLCPHIFHMSYICHEYDFVYHRRRFKHLQRIGYQRLTADFHVLLCRFPAHAAAFPCCQDHSRTIFLFHCRPPPQSFPDRSAFAHSSPPSVRPLAFTQLQIGNGIQIPSGYIPL